MISYVVINNSIKTLMDFKRTLRPGCDIDRALSVAITVLKEKKREPKPQKPTTPQDDRN